MQFRDLLTQYKTYERQIDDRIKQVLLRGDFIEGKEVKELEKKLAAYVDVKHCITCANGTEAMTLVLMAWGVKEGDAVFIPDFTFFSTGEVVSLVGATPIFVDVDVNTFTMDPLKLQQAIEKTLEKRELQPKVIIPVDLFGLPANFIEIEQIAEKYNLKVLEDGAQGFGGSIYGKKACSFGDAATTSFFPAKPLGCFGDGGAIFTNNEELAKLVRSLKNHGKGEHKYDNIRIGVNSRLDTIQAAVLLVKLEAFINHELKDVNRKAIHYTNQLKDFVKTPTIPTGYYSSYAQYTITLKNKDERDALQQHLKTRHIPSTVYYPKPMHRQGAFTNEYLESDFEVTNFLCDRVLSLPIHPYLDVKTLSYVTSEIQQFFEGS